MKIEQSFNKEKTLEEIKKFQVLIHQYIDEIEEDSIDEKRRVVANKIQRELKISGNDSNKLTQIIFTLENAISLYPENLQHDILCFFIKSLRISDVEIPKKNFYSEQFDYEYDPAKNGQNILKHGISFQDVIENSNNNLGEICAETEGEGEKRFIYFSKYYLNNEDNKYILSVCVISGDLSNDFYEDIAKEFIKMNEDKYYDNGSILNISIYQKDIFKFLNKLDTKKIEKIQNSSNKRRFISARLFTKDNFEKIIGQTIRDDGLELEIIESLRTNVKRLLKEYP